ncbi:hypothetical protein ABT336_09380 [Micromonospora sp. NPDC000207]|uniref:hypothetical protein n=1 Tax=Micromonospora sp. NPDC000207 TaxID=3154246 RepID=UPI00331A5A45
MPRLLAAPPDPIRSIRMPHWVGISALAGGIVLAAVVIPPQLAPADDQLPDRSLGGVAATPSGPPEVGSTPDGGPAAPPVTTPTPTDTPSGPSPSPRDTGPTPTPSRSEQPEQGGPTATAPATPTPTRDSGSSSFKPITVQAEDPGNDLGGGAKVAACSACDGGARVRYLGTLTAYLNNPTAGRRTITVTYQVDGQREIKISVNDRTPTTHVVTGTGWDKQHTLQYTASLPAGRVSLRFFNDTGPPPDIDKITIS